MAWTTTLPTEPGHYRWRPGETTDKIFQSILPPGIYCLELTGIGQKKLHLALPRDKNRYPVEWMGGEWMDKQQLFDLDKG